MEHRQRHDGHAGADASRVDQPALGVVVAEQERADEVARAFGVGPSDDDELGAVEALALDPRAAVARQVRAVDPAVVAGYFSAGSRPSETFPVGDSGRARYRQWRRWLETNDLTPSFQEYRRLIKLLIWRNPLPKGGHLVLKCPQYSRNIEQFSEVFPEARFVCTHRDPFRVCTSVCTLASHVTAPFSAREDMWRPDGSAVKDVVDLVERGLMHIMEFDDAASARIVHVAYPALVRDPTAVVESVYTRLGVDAPRDIASRVGGYRVASAGKRASPPKDLPTYGLDHDAFLARPVVQSYCKRFGVQPEATRLTGI